MSEPLEKFCLRCGAEPGQACVGARGHERKTFHRGRGSRRRAHAIYASGLKTESPIETELADAIASWIKFHDADATIKTQQPIGPFRADILVESRGDRLVVEADGAAFHNSIEQVERDKRRDRYCALNGIAVMRFTGREIMRDIRGCAAQVGLWIRGRK